MIVRVLEDGQTTKKEKEHKTKKSIKFNKEKFEIVKGVMMRKDRLTNYLEVNIKNNIINKVGYEK